MQVAGAGCRLQVAGCGLQDNYTFKKHDLFDPTFSQVDRTRLLQWFYTLTSY